MLENIRESISKNLDQYKEMTPEDIMNERKNKFLKIGRNDGFMSNAEDLSNLTIKKNNFDNIFKSKIGELKSIETPTGILTFKILLFSLDLAHQIRQQYKGLQLVNLKQQ